MSDAQPTSDDSAREPASLRVPGADGLSLRILAWSTDGVPLLFVHGFGNEAHIWDDFVPALAPHYAVHALDWRGHGASDWHPSGAYDWDDHLRDLEAVVAHMGWERFVLCGHSLGGRVSLLFAGRHPEKLAGLVVVDTGPEHDPRGQVRIRMDAEAHPSPTFASVAEYETMLAHQYVAATSSAIRRMAKHGLRARDDGRFELVMDPKLRDFGRANLDADELARRDRELTERLWKACETVPCPVLVVRGAASDILAPDVADAMEERIAN
ncbi:MAG: alpha/beta hydrolase, partial [Myxococcales bacterium]|nr:alpha/beta hydrolase [Myxococcales bacterium]